MNRKVDIAAINPPIRIKLSARLMTNKAMQLMVQR